ncbi:MAG: hypothetical protein J6M65_11300 [Eubacterium sp.]|nr:hypothetical protein [Eubacterium sp.]
MKINIKKVFAFLAAVIILISSMPAISSEAATLRTKSKSYGYYNPRLKSNIATVEITGLTKSQKITKGTVKSSNTAVGKIMGYTRRKYSSSTAKVDSKSQKKSSSSYTYTIRVRVLSVGNTNITYDIDGKTYTTVLYIDEFKNPITKMTITGVESGKDISTKIDFSKKNGKLIYNSANVKKAKFKITPVDGWRVVRMSCENESTGYEYSKSSYSSSKKLKSITLGKLKSKYDYTITATLVDNYGNSAKVTITLESPSNKL